MYGFDENTSEGGGARIPAGITENVNLNDVLFEPLKADGTGDQVLKFLFSDAGGSSFTHIEFPIDSKRLVELAIGWGKSKAEAESYSKTEYEAQGERIKHILSCFIPKDKCVFKASNFSEFAEGVIKLLGENHTGVDVRIKTVYKKGSQYTTFPKRAFKPFIQPMSIPNKIVIDPKWDIVEAPTPDASDDVFMEKATTPITGDSTEDVPW
jgi:hypothetical protein